MMHWFRRAQSEGELFSGWATIWLWIWLLPISQAKEKEIDFGESLKQDSEAIRAGIVLVFLLVLDPLECISGSEQADFFFSSFSFLEQPIHRDNCKEILLNPFRWLPKASSQWLALRDYLRGFFTFTPFYQSVRSEEQMYTTPWAPTTDSGSSSSSTQFKTQPLKNVFVHALQRLLKDIQNPVLPIYSMHSRHSPAPVSLGCSLPPSGRLALVNGNVRVLRSSLD